MSKIKKIKIVEIEYEDTPIDELPTSPYLPPIYPFDPNPWKLNSYASCPKCGLQMTGIMGYVCANHPCPVGLGGVWSATDIQASYVSNQT